MLVHYFQLDLISSACGYLILKKFVELSNVLRCEPLTLFTYRDADMECGSRVYLDGNP